jgi:hypothetical protein
LPAPVSRLAQRAIEAPVNLALLLPCAREAEPFERAYRRHVVLVACCEDGAHTRLAQRPGDQRAGSLRREPSPPGGRNDAVADLHQTVGVWPAEEAGVADDLPGLALDEHPDPEWLVTQSKRRLRRKEIDQVQLRPVGGQLRAEQARGVLSIER